MTVIKLIKELEKLFIEHGDLPVVTSDLEDVISARVTMTPNNLYIVIESCPKK